MIVSSAQKINFIPHFFLDILERFCELVTLSSFAGQAIFFQLGFTSCKIEQPLRDMELQEKQAQKRLQDTSNLFRKNLQLKDVF